MISAITTSNINHIRFAQTFNANQTNSVTTPEVKTNSGLLNKYLDNLALQNIPAVKKPETTAPINYHNNLRQLFVNNEAKILAIIPRTFNAKDTNGNAYIDGGEIHGTFLNAIDRLDEVKAQGFNTLHILPIHPTGKMKAMGRLSLFPERFTFN